MPPAKPTNDKKQASENCLDLPVTSRAVFILRRVLYIPCFFLLPRIARTFSLKLSFGVIIASKSSVTFSGVKSIKSAIPMIKRTDEIIGKNNRNQLLSPKTY